MPPFIDPFKPLKFLIHLLNRRSSFFTGRGIWVSGRDMFLVGFGVAAVGYLIGQLITRFL